MKSICEWVEAESEKRLGAAAQGMGVLADWNELSKRVELAKATHSKAQSDYIHHVIACSVCNAHVFESRSKQHRGR